MLSYLLSFSCTYCTTFFFFLGAGNEAYWNGWWDEPSEGTFMDVNTGQPLRGGDFQPWFMGEPNGLDSENCGVTWSRRNSWNDDSCHLLHCGFCHLDEAPTFTLRGMCQDVPTAVLCSRYCTTPCLS